MALREVGQRTLAWAGKKVGANCPGKHGKLRRFSTRIGTMKRTKDRRAVPWPAEVGEADGAQRTARPPQRFIERETRGTA
jgi:hypothetical protein